MIGLNVIAIHVYRKNGLRIIVCNCVSVLHDCMHVCGTETV